MGNSSSSQQRDGDEVAQPQQLQLQQLGRSRLPAVRDEGALRTARRRVSASWNQLTLSRSNVPFTTMDHEQPTYEQVPVQSTPRNEIDDAHYESDDGPIFRPDNADLSPSQGITSLERSPSTMSRLGSRLLPDSVVRNLHSSGEETAEEGEALRQGVAIRRRTSVWERRAPSSGQERFSISGTIRRHRESRAESRRRSIRGPFPFVHSDHYPLQSEPSNSLGLESNVIDTTHDAMSESTDAARHRARFSRVRRSLTLPISNLFGASTDRHLSRYIPRSPTPHPGHVSPTNDSDQLLPSVPDTAVRPDVDDVSQELEAVEPEARTVPSSSRITSGMSTIRRIPHGIRSRSRFVRRGEHPPLSQVLQLAAAAIAAQLGGQSGSTPGSGTGSGSDGLRALGGDAFDGSIQNFVQTLQDAASAQAGEDIDINATDGELPPVNFMRVFQFPNDVNGSPIPQPQTHGAEHIDTETGTPADTDRSVTLVLVGVRSMPTTHEAHANEHGGLRPSLDTLLSLPFLPPAMNNGSSGALFRRTDTRTRNSRRHSLTNFNFHTQYENQRHHRTRSSINRPTSEQPVVTSSHGSANPMSESPPGPHPPPSTPADIRSGQATPIRRPSSASGVRTPSLPDLEEDRTGEPMALPTESSSTIPRQRRRSDSEFARRPELGSGAARRNGMVEPDRPAIGAGRSWLIYVVGTNVSHDHPAFTMPSLFTDNPTYEDMQMLSTLLGPVKPPVASQEDINVAGGLYRLSLRNSVLVAEPIHTSEDSHVISITKGDRCLICLCDYDVEEIVRQLDSCRHVFHRECIDEWLTTGRNSCPMCRGQGVKETSAGSSRPRAGEATTF